MRFEVWGLRFEVWGLRWLFHAVGVCMSEWRGHHLVCDWNESCRTHVTGMSHVAHIMSFVKSQLTAQVCMVCTYVCSYVCSYVCRYVCRYVYISQLHLFGRYHWRICCLIITDAYDVFHWRIHPKWDIVLSVDSQLKVQVFLYVCRYVYMSQLYVLVRNHWFSRLIHPRMRQNETLFLVSTATNSAGMHVCVCFEKPVCVCVCMSVCVCMYVCILRSLCVYVCVCLCVYACMCVFGEAYWNQTWLCWSRNDDDFEV